MKYLFLSIHLEHIIIQLHYMSLHYIYNIFLSFIGSDCSQYPKRKYYDTILILLIQKVSNIISVCYIKTMVLLIQFGYQAIYNLFYIVILGYKIAKNWNRKTNNKTEIWPCRRKPHQVIRRLYQADY